MMLRTKLLLGKLNTPIKLHTYCRLEPNSATRSTPDQRRHHTPATRVRPPPAAPLHAPRQSARRPTIPACQHPRGPAARVVGRLLDSARAAGGATQAVCTRLAAPAKEWTYHCRVGPPKALRCAAGKPCAAGIPWKSGMSGDMDGLGWKRDGIVECRRLETQSWA